MFKQTLIRDLPQAFPAAPPNAETELLFRFHRAGWDSRRPPEVPLLWRCRYRSSPPMSPVAGCEGTFAGTGYSRAGLMGLPNETVGIALPSCLMSAHHRTWQQSLGERLSGRCRLLPRHRTFKGSSAKRSPPRWFGKQAHLDKFSPSDPHKMCTLTLACPKL